MIAACSAGSESHLWVDIVSDVGGPSPDRISVFWFPPGQENPTEFAVPIGTPARQGDPLASLRVSLSGSRGERRVLARAMRGAMLVSVAAARIPEPPPPRLALRLMERLSDVDEDGLPDSIDDDCLGVGAASCGPPGERDATAPLADGGVGVDSGTLDALVDRTVADGGVGERSAAPDGAPDGSAPDAMGATDARPAADVRPDVAPGPDPIAHWTMDDGAGSTSARDSSGRGHTGVLQRLDPATAWTTGRRGGALSFPYSPDGWVRVARTGALDALRALTIAAWTFRRQNRFPNAAVLSRPVGAGGATHYGLMFNANGAPVFAIKASPSSTTVSIKAPGPAPLETWVHLAATFDGAVMRLYVNGREQASAPLAGALAPDSAFLMIGAEAGADGNSISEFAGEIDDVMLFPQALEAPKIAELAAP